MVTALFSTSQIVPAPQIARVVSRFAPDARHIARLTSAAVVSYLITKGVTDGPIDLTCALTAVLVVQASAYSTVKMGLVRVGAVLTGVLIAVAMSAVVGLTWWSLGIAIALALVLAKAFRLGDQALETPISAMLILGVTNLAIAAETRLVTTLIGAGTGIAFSLLLPRRVPSRQAAASVRESAVQTAESLTQAAMSMLSRPVTSPQVETWLATVTRAQAQVAQAREDVSLVRERRLLNPLALSEPSVEPVLRTGIDTIEASLDAVRVLFVRMLREAPSTETRSAADPDAEQSGIDDGYGNEIREAFSVVLTWLAQCVVTFGDLVQAEAHQAAAGTVAGKRSQLDSQIDSEIERSLAEGLTSLREARAFLTELLLVDARTQTSQWLLRGSILSAVEHIIDQLNLEHRARVRAEIQHGVVPRLQLQYLRELRPTRIPNPIPARLPVPSQRVRQRASSAVRAVSNRS